MRSLFLLLICVATAHAEETDAEARGLLRMRALEAALASPGEAMAVTMQLIAPDGRQEVRSFRMAQLSDASARRSLIRFEAPAAIARTALLMVQQTGQAADTWLYVPALDQVRRVAAQDRKESFVGSQFTIEDLTVTLDPAARIYTALGPAPCGEGRTCTQVEDKPRTDAAAKASGYGRVVLYLDDALGVAHRIDFYGKDGALTKVMTTKGLVQVGDRWRFDVGVITDARTGATTVMTVRERQGGVDASVFSPSTLGAP